MAGEQERKPAYTTSCGVWKLPDGDVEGMIKVCLSLVSISLLVFLARYHYLYGLGFDMPMTSIVASTILSLVLAAVIGVVSLVYIYVLQQVYGKHFSFLASVVTSVLFLPLIITYDIAAISSDRILVITYAMFVMCFLASGINIAGLFVRCVDKYEKKNGRDLRAALQGNDNHLLKYHFIVIFMYTLPFLVSLFKATIE